MSRLVPVASLLVGIALVASACGGDSQTPPSTTVAIAEDPDSFLGADGVEVDVADPSRIIALNGDITEILFELGVGDSVIGIDLTTTYPEEATALPDVGLGRSFDAEAVIALQPTLVIGDTQVGDETSIDRVRAAGIPLAIIEPTATLESVERKIATIASMVDREQEGAELIDRVNSEIDAALELASQATTTPDAAYLYVRGPETLLMFGNGMPTHFMIEAAAGEDVMGAAGVTFAEPLSAERLVTADPEVIITSTQGFEILGGLDTFLALPGVADTRAGASGSVITFDEAMFLGMGPRVGQALQLLVEALHPELSGS